MNGLELMIVFVCGALTGIILFDIGVLIIGKKSLDKWAAYKKSVSDRLVKVKELTDYQLDMQSATSGPQKNALDGKYKNSLNATIKKVEEEKTELLKSILNDGYDPEVMTQGPNGIEKMKLSALMARQGHDLNPKSKVENIAKPKNPFTVIKGGKSDNGDGQTFH